jgi:hypothetical protein
MTSEQRSEMEKKESLEIRYERKTKRIYYE